MLRRLTVVTALAAGLSIAAAITLATPALAKGPTQARITGSGLARAIVVTGNGEPGQQSPLGTLATQTGLFFVLFGTNAGPPSLMPLQVRTPPPQASLGPRYAISYTVPAGITAHPDERSAQVRQDLYPRAAGGPLIYTPPGQRSGPFPVAGWLRASHDLPRTLAGLGLPPAPGTQAAAATHLRPAAHPVTARQAGPGALPWLIASAAAIAAAALAGTVLLVRRRKPATTHES